MLPKTSTFKSLSYCKTPLNIPRFGRKYFSYSRHIGVSVRVAQSTFAFKCLSQKSHVLFLLMWTRLFFAPLPPDKMELQNWQSTQTYWGSLVVSCHKSPTQQLVSWLCNRSNKLFRSQTNFQSQNEFLCKICILRCKNPLVHSGQGLKLLQETFQKPKHFSSRRKSEESSNVWSTHLHPLVPPELSVVDTPLP